MVNITTAGHISDKHLVVSRGQDDSAALERVVEEVAMVAEATRFNVKMHRDDNEVRFEFEAASDFLVTRNALSELHCSTHSHTETFIDSDDGWRRSWAYATESSLMAAGVKADVDYDGEAVRIKFQSAEAMTMFSALNDTGYYEALTKTLINTRGVPPPGAVPY